MTQRGMTMLDLSQYQGIVFDMDGTLIDSMGEHMLAWEQTCKHFGYPFDAEYMNGLGGVPTQATVVLLNQKHGLSHDPLQVAQAKRRFWEQMDSAPVTIDATIAVLEHYRTRMPVGVGTGAERPHAEKMLRDTGLMDKIQTLVTASDVRQGKPHPETFLQVADNLGVPAQHCVVFEDTEIGRQAAEAAGMDCIMVENGRILL